MSAITRQAPDAALPADCCACEVCAAAEQAGQNYFQAAFGRPERRAATGEAIADTLGYCRAHGRALLAAGLVPAALTGVFERAVCLTMPLLQERNLGRERFQQVYFGAHRACPACAHAQRAASRHASWLAQREAGAGAGAGLVALQRLCAGHLHLATRRLDPTLRMPVLAGAADTLDARADALGALLVAGEVRDARVCDVPLLAAALGMAGAAMSAGAAGDPPPELPETVSPACACSICLELAGIRRRWAQDVTATAGHRLDAWLLMPACSEHMGALVALNDAALATVSARHVLLAAADQLRQQLRVLVRAAASDAEQAAARIARWGRRPRRRHAAPVRPAVPRVVRCAVCERLAVGEQRAIGTLLRQLQSSAQRSTFERGWGLCMKHHAHAYLLAPQGAVRCFLAADQRRRLGELEGLLARGAPAQWPSEACMLGVRRFSGFG